MPSHHQPEPTDGDRNVDTWPSVRTFAGDQLAHIRMPVGGIGTGCVSLGGRGQLCDWELFNRPAKGFDARSFFAISVQPDSPGERVTRVLEGELSTAERLGRKAVRFRWPDSPGSGRRRSRPRTPSAGSI